MAEKPKKCQQLQIESKGLVEWKPAKHNFCFMSRNIFCLFNKRRSRAAIITVKGAQKRLIEQTTNDIHKKNSLDIKFFNWDFDRRIQAVSFR